MVDNEQFRTNNDIPFPMFATKLRVAACGGCPNPIGSIPSGNVGLAEAPVGCEGPRPPKAKVNLPSAASGDVQAEAGARGVILSGRGVDVGGGVGGAMLGNELAKKLYEEKKAEGKWKTDTLIYLRAGSIDNSKLLLNSLQIRTIVAQESVH